mgnify:CR=1 FL=1
MKAFIIGLLVLVMAIPVAASQFDFQVEQCDREVLQAIIAEIGLANTSLNELIATSDDTAGVLTALRGLSTQIETTLRLCDGLVLRGEPQPGQIGVVLGPMEIPDGVYRAVLTTPGGVAIDFVPISGSCSLRFDVDAGQAANGSQAVLSATSCAVLVEIIANAAWELALQPIIVGVVQPGS